MLQGGVDADDKYQDAILHYKGSTSTNNGWWEPVGQMNVSRAFHAVSLVNDVCPTTTSASTTTTTTFEATTNATIPRRLDDESRIVLENRNTTIVWIFVGAVLLVVIIVAIIVVVVAYRRKDNDARQGRALLYACKAIWAANGNLKHSVKTLN